MNRGAASTVNRHEGLNLRGTRGFSGNRRVMTMANATTGELKSIELANESLRLELAPELGAGVARLRFITTSGEVDVWRPAPADAHHFNQLSNYILAPWCNRIDGAAFDFDGRRHTLKSNWHDGSAIHGDVNQRAWRLTDRSPVSARFELRADTRERNWSWPFEATARYELQDAALVVELEIRNLGGSPMPAGLGMHPFWMQHLKHADELAVVTMNLAGRYPVERVMVTGPAVREELCDRLTAGTTISEPLDDVFCGFQGAEIRWPKSRVMARMTAGPENKHAVIYHEPPHDWFCLEPVSMANNGISMRALVPGTGVRVVNPKQTISSWYRFEFIEEA